MTDYRIKLSPTVYQPTRVLAIIRIKGHRQDYYATGRNPREAQRLAWCNFLTLGGKLELRSSPAKPEQEQELKQYCLSCLRPMTQDEWDTHLVWASDSVGCFDDPGGEWVCPNSEEVEVSVMSCTTHRLIESSMVSHVLGRCIDCGEWSDTDGNAVEIGDWQLDCSGADYWNGKFDCSYGYRSPLIPLKCTDCKHAHSVSEHWGKVE